MKTNTENAPRLVRDYKPETHSLIVALQRAGFILAGVDDGDGHFQLITESQTATAALCAVDEATLFVTNPADGKRLAVFLVLGNSPGELVNDCSGNDALWAAISANADLWEGREQPMEATN